MRNGSGDVCLRIGDESAHLLCVMLKGFQAYFPGNGVMRRWALRPIARRPIRRNVHGIAAEFENIPLRDAHVLEQFPGGMRSAFRLYATLFGGESGKSGFPIQMGVMPEE